MLFLAMFICLYIWYHVMEDGSNQDEGHELSMVLNSTSVTFHMLMHAILGA